MLAAAVVAVHREGLRVPMATIAADAGVGVATLYRRFPTRDDLFDALTRRSFLLVLDNARTADATTGTGLDAVSRYYDTTIARRDELFLPLHGGPAVATDATRAVQAEVHAAVAHLVARGQHDGSIRRHVTPRDVILFGAVLAQPLANIRDWDETAQRLKRVHLDGLSPA